MRVFFFVYYSIESYRYTKDKIKLYSIYKKYMYKRTSIKYLYSIIYTI